MMMYGAATCQPGSPLEYPAVDQEALLAARSDLIWRQAAIVIILKSCDYGEPGQIASGVHIRTKPLSEIRRALFACEICIYGDQ